MASHYALSWNLTIDIEHQSTTGVRAAPECLEAYLSLKQQGAKKTSKRYIIFKLNDKLDEIVVEKESDNANYEEFLESLPEDAPRYVVYDVEYETDDGGQRNKLVFISWCVRGLNRDT